MKPALAPWFGSNRTLAEVPARFLHGRDYLAVPFAGSMCELPYFTARTIVVNDLHRHIVNLAAVTAHPVLGPKLIRRLRREIVHPDMLKEAQAWCEAHPDPDRPSLKAARMYFLTAWTARAAQAGTRCEFNAPLSVRWTAGGGDTAVRYCGAVRGLRTFRRVFRRCTFTAMDALDLVAKVEDRPRNGIYADPPFPGPGDRYAHKVDEKFQRRLAESLTGFKQAAVVCRFYDHPLVRALYRPQDGWRWCLFTGRTQSNKKGNRSPEVLVVRNCTAKDGFFQ